MALISCPHCGKQVSDTSERCVYCGHEFQKNENTPVAPKASSKPSVTDPMLAWQVLCPQEYKKNKILYWVIRITLCTLLGVIPVILLFLVEDEIIYPIREEFQKSDFFTQLALYADYKKFLDSLCTASIVVGVCGSIALGFGNFWRIMPLIKWMKKIRFDVGPFLREDEILVTGRKADAYWSAYCKLSPNGKIVWGVESLAEGALFAFAPILCIYGLRGRLSVLENYLKTGEWVAFDIGWLFDFLIFIAISFVVLVTVHVICYKICKNYLVDYAAQKDNK